MSQSPKTTIVPPSNPDSIFNTNSLKFVLVTNDQDLASMASNMALDTVANIERNVVWFTQPDWENLKQLFGGLPDEIDGVKAFVLSTKNKVADIITSNEIADYVRVGRAYATAGLEQYN